MTVYREASVQVTGVTEPWESESPWIGVLPVWGSGRGSGDGAKEER